MNDKPANKLGLKDWMLVFSALEKSYGRDTGFDIASRSVEPMLKLVAIASVDEKAAQVLLHDLATLRHKREGTPEDNARRWQRRVNRALDRARYEPPQSDSPTRPREKVLV